MPPRKTQAQIGLILADFDAAVRDKRKAEKREKELKAEINAMGLVEGKTYGDMIFGLGTAREILDQPGIVETMTALASSPEIIALAKRLKLPVPVVPTKLTARPLVITPKPVAK